MYPNLTPTLTVLLVAAMLVAGYVAVRRPFLRRLAVRQVSRRRYEAMLVIVGSLLGTSVIMASLVVGDTLNFSVKQDAYRHLGPVDEIVSSATLRTGERVAARLAPLRHDPRVDGVLTVLMGTAAVTAGEGGARRAVPRVPVIGADLGQAASFGGPGDPSGLSGPTPGLNGVVINTDLASALRVSAGNSVTFYVAGHTMRLHVDAVVPTSGLAGFGTAGSDGSAFVNPELLRAAARLAPTASPAMLTLVSNTGGVESGDALTSAVSARITTLLGPLAGHGAGLQRAKHDVLGAARAVGDSIGALFLFIGSFCIIVGVVLLMNIYIMLAEERKPEMGMLRAIGMKRSRLVRSFMIEGSIYAAVASLLGVAVGLGVGRLAVIMAARLFGGGGWGSVLILTYHVTTTSLVNSVAAGFLIAFATVVGMSIRISRFNIIAAIRDLPRSGIRAHRRLVLAFCAFGSALLAAASVPAIAQGRSVAIYVLPAAAVMLAVPLARLVATPRVAYSAAATAVLAWTSLANTVRPQIFNSNSTSTYVIMGCLLTLSAVVLASQNQDVLVRPFRSLIERPTPAGLTARVAVTYPLARKFRTGAILVMYSLIVFTLVLLTVLSTMIQSTVNQAVSFAAGGYALRADFNPGARVPAVIARPGATGMAGQISAVAPLLIASAQVRDLGPHRVGPAPVSVIGLPRSVSDGGGFALDSHLARLGPTDGAAWRAVAADPRYVMLDAYVNAKPGAPAKMYRPGDHLVLVDQATGRAETKIIAGIMKSSLAFYGVDGQSTYPIVMSASAARAEFGGQARFASALIRPAPGASAQALAARLQARYLTSGMVVVRISQQVQRNFAASLGFFQLLEGFLALGLLIAIAGLGIVMVRAVRERRRTVGVLRALGYRARWVEFAFLGESALVATEGTVLGAGLSIFISYLLFRNNAAFSGYTVGFTVPWVSLTVIVITSLLASLAATYLPARKAAHIPPAAALRIAD
jgi:putative ABC transport system permease protein